MPGLTLISPRFFGDARDMHHNSNSTRLLAKYLIAVLALIPVICDAQSRSQSTLTYYADQRDYNSLNIQTHSQLIPTTLDIWGFTDFHSQQDQSSRRFDLTRYFAEYRLRTALDKRWMRGIAGLGVEIEYNDSSGPGNELLRMGITYRHPLPLSGRSRGWLQWRLLPYETDGSGQQFSLIHFLAWGDRLALTGFADFNHDETAANRWVAESQVSYVLSGSLRAVAEVRYNGFEEANPALDGTGVAIGVSLTP